MKIHGVLGLQGLIFFLVVSAFTNIYITQPVLPVLAAEFGVSATGASLSISLVILGIALSNLPFGMLGDRYPIRPLILAGGAAVVVGGLICAATQNYTLLIGARFVQGLFLPALTTCVAAHLANSLPADRLNVVMGSYVSATVVGGLGGRLLGGFLYPTLPWRAAFVIASALLLAAVAAAALGVPGEPARARPRADDLGFRELLSSWPRFRIYGAAFGAFWVFSSVFNYLPFYLSRPPFQAPTRLVALLYLSYLVGAVISPLAGRLADRIGNGAAMALGAAVFGLALAGTLVGSLAAVVAGLAGVCAGFFTTHATAAGALNSGLSTSRSRANALYVLFYYTGGYAGITASGYAYQHAGWPAVVGLGLFVLVLPFGAGLAEAQFGRRPLRDAR
jgi:YNFM family putative membrane transporter